MSHETSQTTVIKGEGHRMYFQKLAFSLGQINHDVTKLNEMRI